MNPRVPQPSAPFKHSVAAQIRFNDIDIVGHLNNNAYFSFFDLGKMEYFNAVMGKNLHWQQIPVVIVNINANFYSPTLIDEKIEVLTQVTRIGDKSLTLEQRVVNSETGDVKCVATTIMAGFDPHTATSRPIPDDWREGIKKFESRDL